MLSYSSYILVALAALSVTCHALSKYPGISGLPGIPGRDGLKGKQTSSFARDPPHEGCMSRTDDTAGHVLSREQMCSAQEGKENGGNGQFNFFLKNSSPLSSGGRKTLNINISYMCRNAFSRSAGKAKA